jgi:hypothetical protein
VRVELSLRKVVVHGVSKGGPERGSETLRDTRYGVPATDAQRVALANRQPLWFNSTYSWWESYYAVTGLAGLAVPGLVAGAPSGWYPVATGPFQRLQPAAVFSASSGNPIRGWHGTTHRKGGSDWFTYSDTNGRVQVKKAGRYQFQVWTTQQTGTGTANYHLRQMTLAGVTEQHVDGLAFELGGSLYTRPNVNAEMLIPGSREVDFICNSGVLDVHMLAISTAIRGEFTVRYLGPALVTD